jgi:hypothetical protein
LEKVAQNAKTLTSKLNLKPKNIQIKLLLKPSNKPWVKIACLGLKNLCKKLSKWGNVAQSGHTDCPSKFLIEI